MTAGPTVAVLDYGVGNLRSVARALERVGARPDVTGHPERAARAEALVLPGVGAFGRGMRGLREAGLQETIRQAVASHRPVLGVCLGLQVLFEGSEEGEEEGLGLLPGRVRRLPPSVKVPHIGWNQVAWTADHPVARGIPSGTHFYFVHSFAVPADHPAAVAVAEHGEPFAAAVATGSVFATQFHPEKSGRAGIALYEGFVRRVREAAA